ncbi:MAG: hypothetical protein IJ668_05085 [Selenomonadaceae bacterium]|nr:hypothetical protein [Selenomonadaceae bacterium]
MKKTLYQALSKCNTEEEVKFSFLKFFGLKLDSRKNIDFYTPQILFEFKFDGELPNVKRRARAFAQSLYYIRRLKYGDDMRVPSRFIAVVDKQSAAIIKSELLSNYWLKSKRAHKYDWDLAPSTPCKKLIADLSVEPLIVDCHIYNFADESDQQNFVELLNNYLQSQPTLFELKKEITEDNFYAIFQYWEKQFGRYVENSHKSSEYFLTDIESEKSLQFDERHVLFRLDDDTLIEKLVPSAEYKYFWSVYEKVTSAQTMIAIRQKMDRMTQIEMRRFTGEFFTPIEHARKALEYIGRVVGAKWWQTGKYRLWDMAAGTGNLEFMLPADALPYCYISTLLDDDAAYCRRLYPSATVFQYDYLNDDIPFLENAQLSLKLGFKRKMPKKLEADLSNPELKWIVLVNPPYATANNHERDKTQDYKTSVSMTKVRKLMTEGGMGEVSRELSAQFFYRIDREFRERQTILGVFSKIKYITAPYDQRLRDQFFDYKFEGGFVFPSKAFQGTKGQFPVGFAMWNLAEHIPLSKQRIKFDVLDDRLEKYASKRLRSVPRERLLNSWIKRPRPTKKFPPMSSALVVARHNKKIRDRITEDFIATLMVTGNDLMHQNYTALLSGPYVGMGAFSVTAENFERSMTVHAVRRLPKATWLNDKDQFLRPKKKLPPEFVDDCVVWSLFAPSNNTASLVNVEYEGTLYRIINHLYPFPVDEIMTWAISVPELFLPLPHETDRFAADWLKVKILSAEATNVLNAARSIYKTFYARLRDLDRKKYRLEAWDAGWYQIRRSLEDAHLLDGEEFRLAFERLSAKLLPQVYELGFLSDEVTYFD